jgi:hypothetical protein
VSHLRVLWRRARNLAVRSTAASGCAGGIALVLITIGVLATLTQMVSPNFLLWTGHPVPGLNLGGTVNYRYRGIEYTFEAHDRAQNQPPERVTVYLDPNDPVLGVEDKLSTRIGDAAFALTPFAAAAISLAVGWDRRRRARNRAAAQRDRDGYGFDPRALRRHR